MSIGFRGPSGAGPVSTRLRRGRWSGVRGAFVGVPGGRIGGAGPGAGANLPASMSWCRSASPATSSLGFLAGGPGLLGPAGRVSARFPLARAFDASADGPDGGLPGRHGPAGFVVVDDGPPDSAPGPASPGIVASGGVAAHQLAPVGPPEGDVVLRAFRQEAMFVALAVPEAAPAALAAGRAEEGARGLDDPHGAECNGEGVPASRAGCQ